MDPAAQFTVRAAIAPLLGDPRASAPLTSQLLAGETVRVFETRGDWRRVAGEDGYEGWMHHGYLDAAVGDEPSRRVSLGCIVRDSVALARPLPLGARLRPEAELLDGAFALPQDLPTRFGFDPETIGHSSESLFAGASYLWGGVTPWGCDCSGFVQRVFRLHGVSLPRDAWQQALSGIGTSTSALEEHSPGDLLFFSDNDKRVTHVGIALSGARMVHSSLTRGGIAIERMDSAEPYVSRLRDQCTGVRRVHPAD
ncbi:MAG TPA: C40 family peptidase [Gemmatimonas sp.]|nr:C40 family peptidase [Gemmatimonas sp.]